MTRRGAKRTAEVATIGTSALRGRASVPGGLPGSTPLTILRRSLSIMAPDLATTENDMKRLLCLALTAAFLSACGETDPDTEFVNPGNVIRVEAASATPDPAIAGDSPLLQIQVVARNTVRDVRVDLSPFSGDARADLNDSGLDGDATAADGVWSLQFSIPAGANSGVIPLTYRVRDREGFAYDGVVNVTVANEAPVFSATGSSLENADGISGSTFGPAETMQFRIAVEDPDGPTAQMTVSADLSSHFAGAADEPLSFNASTGLWELDYIGPRDMTPTGVTGQVAITATDTLGTSRTHWFALNAQNWVGLAGSDAGTGISTSLGWTLGSACAVDSQGRIYVAYSSRVNVPSSVSTTGWIYAVYVKRYDPLTGTWSGLNGSDSGMGLNINTQGRVISSGYMGEIKYYSETNQGANNKEAVYVLFHGNPDPDPGENLWDSFLYRYNITDGIWESLGTGSDASDWITDAPGVGLDDVGGFTRSGDRAQEPRIAFDPATDDAYVTYHQRVNGIYDVFVRRFNRVSGVWEDRNGTTPGAGIADNPLVNCQYPQIAIHGGYAYVAWVQGGSAGDIIMRRMELATGNWSPLTVTIHDAAAQPGAGFPALAVDSAGNLFIGFKVTFTGPTDQQVHVATTHAANWDNAAAWQGAGSGGRHINIADNTVSNVIKLRLAVDSADGVYAVWNQVHPGSTLSNKRGVFVARFDGGQWRAVRGSLSDDGLSNYGDEDHWLPDIAVDPQGRPVVCYDTFWGTGTGNSRRMIYVKALR